MTKFKWQTIAIAIFYFALMLGTLTFYTNSDVMSAQLGMVQPTFALYIVAITLQSFYGVSMVFLFETKWIDLPQVLMSMVVYLLMIFLLFTLRIYPIVAIVGYLMLIAPILLFLILRRGRRFRFQSKKWILYIVLVGFFASFLLPPTYYVSSVVHRSSLYQNPVPQNLTREEYFDIYKTELSLLKIDAYRHCTEICRIELMQLVENIEAALANRPAILIESLQMQPDIYGHFSFATARIGINIGLFSDRTAQNLLHTVLHEGRHVYQYHQVYGPNPVESEEIRFLWQQNLQSYKHIANFSFEDYANQPVEVDAERFASETLLTYCEAFSTISAQCDAYVKRGLRP